MFFSYASPYLSHHYVSIASSTLSPERIPSSPSNPFSAGCIAGSAVAVPLNLMCAPFIVPLPCICSGPLVLTDQCPPPSTLEAHSLVKPTPLPELVFVNAH